MSHLLDLLYNRTRDGNSTAATMAPAAAAAPAAHAPAGSQVPGQGIATPLGPAAFPVAQARLRPEARLVCHTDPRSAAADRFRYLRMRLRDPWNAGKLRTLLIAGSLANDGKSTVTMNLATVLAERGKRSVLIVEGDLHHSTLAETLQVSPIAGLAQCLTGATEPFSAIRRIEPFGWHLMQAGEMHKNPTELLQTPEFGHILQKVSGHFDWILIDSPPVVPITDALLLQQHCDATLLVVRAGQTPQASVERAVELLGKKHILGIVLNGVEGSLHPYYAYHDNDPATDTA